MAKRGRFSGGAGYGGVPQQIIDQIRKQAAGENTSNTGDTVQPNPDNGSTAPTPRRARVQRMLTAEEIAADPVLSGKLSFDQAKINALKSIRITNLAPDANTAGTKKYRRQLMEMNKLQSGLGINPGEAERQFFAMGGRYNDTRQGGGAGWSENQILDYWRSAGMEDKGLEIVSRIRGYDNTGADLPGGADPGLAIDYKLTPGMAMNVASPVKGLNELQAARLTKLKNLKQGGTTLTAGQQARLKRLRQLKNG
jgi:hypothetical protein